MEVVVADTPHPAGNEQMKRDGGIQGIFITRICPLIKLKYCKITYLHNYFPIVKLFKGI